jgi:hypothetical protein
MCLDRENRLVLFAMNIEQIETFLDLCDTRSFNKTAERLGVTQSTISGRVRALENALSCRLLERSRAGTDLTTEGLRFQPHARAIRLAWRDGLQDARGAGSAARTARIGIQHDLLGDSVADWVTVLQAAMPQTGKTTCYMCACRCGINVHSLAAGQRYEGRQGRLYRGQPRPPGEQGRALRQGLAGIMQHRDAPSRLRAPLKRVGPRGSGEFEEISWDEALEIATEWMAQTAAKDPKKLAFFTGRDQSAEPSPASGRRNSARRTSPPMAGSARSTWRPGASTRWAARSGNSASPTGSTEALHAVRRGRGP